MTTPTNRYVIFEPTMLVAMDLEQCLRDHDPGAEIVLAPSLAEALQLVAGGSVSLAVLHGASDRIAATTVPILLIGDSAEECPGSRHVLLRPFSAEDVAEALTRMNIRSACTQD